MPNIHITQFLDYYIDSSNPQYAVLLKGKWGSGKTHFINEYKNELDSKKKKYIYVSLYGLTNYDEIETKFLESSNPELFNNKTIFTGKIASAFFNEKINGSLSEIKKSLATLNSKNKTLIFDDLERCSIESANLLGYINNFVEHKSYKVILIANEEELDKSGKYEITKEKLIGKTFELKSNVNDAYNYFIKDLENKNNIYSVVFIKYRKLIVNIFNESESNSLRVLRQTILDFERFYDSILKNHIFNEMLLIEITKWFMLFSFEVKQGNTNILDLDNLYEEYEDLVIDKKDDKLDKNEFYKYKNKYNFEDSLDVVLSFKIWKEVLIDSYLNEEEINLMLINSKFYSERNTSLWKKLYNYISLSDKELTEISKEVYYKIYKLEFTNIDEVKMIASILFNLKEKGLLSLSLFSIKYELERQIDFIFKQELVADDLILDKFPNDLYDDSFGGYQIIKSKEFKAIEEYIKNKIEEALIKKLKNDANLILSEIENNNLENIKEMLVHSNHYFSPYHCKPIFKYIDMNKLIYSLENTNNFFLRGFLNILVKRYQHFRTNLLEEKDFLKKLKIRSSELESKKVGLLSGYLFHEFNKKLDIEIKKFP